MSRGRKPGQKLRQTCTDHCSSCGRHFHGLGAFDAHIPFCGTANVQEARNGRGRLLLQVWTSEGFCDLAKDSYEDGALVKSYHPVTIWQVAQTEAQREWLAGKRAK